MSSQTIKEVDAVVLGAGFCRSVYATSVEE